MVEPLPAGDYRIDGGVLVERKTVADLHGSLARGRLWSQVGQVRDVAVLPFLFVEGDDLDSGPRHPNAIRGCLLAIADLGIAEEVRRVAADENDREEMRILREQMAELVLPTPE